MWKNRPITVDSHQKIIIKCLLSVFLFSSQCQNTSTTRYVSKLTPSELCLHSYSFLILIISLLCAFFSSLLFKSDTMLGDTRLNMQQNTYMRNIQETTEKEKRKKTDAVFNRTSLADSEERHGTIDILVRFTQFFSCFFSCLRLFVSISI